LSSGEAANLIEELRLDDGEPPFPYQYLSKWRFRDWSDWADNVRRGCGEQHRAGVLLIDLRDGSNFAESKIAE
jgi:hypothetical protein